MNFGNQQALGAMLLGLGMTPAEFAEKDKDYFSLSFNFLPILAGATGQQASITTNADSWFLGLMATATVRTTAIGTPSITDRPLLITMRDGGSDRLLQSGPSDFDSVVGTAQLPAVWGVPKFLEPNSTFLITLDSLASFNLNVRMSILGFKVFI